MYSFLRKYQSGGTLDVTAMRDDVSNNSEFFRDGNYTRKGRSRLKAIQDIDDNQNKGLKYRIDDKDKSFKVVNSRGEPVSDTGGHGIGGGEKIRSSYGMFSRSKRGKKEVSTIMGDASKYLRDDPEPVSLHESDPVDPGNIITEPIKEGEDTSDLDVVSDEVKANPDTPVVETKKPIRDERVYNAQVKLKEAGFDPGVLDGVYGPKTKAAEDKYRAKIALNNGSGDLVDNTVEIPDDGILVEGDLINPLFADNSKSYSVPENYKKFFADVDANLVSLYSSEIDDTNDAGGDAKVANLREELRRRDNNEAPSGSYKDLDRGAIQDAIIKINGARVNTKQRQVTSSSQNTLDYLDNIIGIKKEEARKAGLNVVSAEDKAYLYEQNRVLDILRSRKVNVVSNLNRYKSTGSNDASYVDFYQGNTLSKKNTKVWDKTRSKVVDRAVYMKERAEVDKLSNKLQGITDLSWMRGDERDKFKDVINKKDSLNSESMNYKGLVDDALRNYTTSSDRPMFYRLDTDEYIKGDNGIGFREFVDKAGIKGSDMLSDPKTLVGLYNRFNNGDIKDPRVFLKNRFEKLSKEANYTSDKTISSPYDMREYTYGKKYGFIKNEEEGKETNTRYIGDTSFLNKDKKVEKKKKGGILKYQQGDKVTYMGAEYTAEEMADMKRMEAAKNKAKIAADAEEQRLRTNTIDITGLNKPNTVGPVTSNTNTGLPNFMNRNSTSNTTGNTPISTTPKPETYQENIDRILGIGAKSDKSEGGLYTDSTNPPVAKKPKWYDKTVVSTTGINTPFGEIQYNDAAQLALAYNAKNKKYGDVPVVLKNYVNKGSRDVLSARDKDSASINQANKQINKLSSGYVGSDPIISMIANQITGNKKNEASTNLIVKRGDYRRQEEDRVAREMETKRMQQSADAQGQNDTLYQNRLTQAKATEARINADRDRDTAFNETIGSLLSNMQGRANANSKMSKQFLTETEVEDKRIADATAEKEYKRASIAWDNSLSDDRMSIEDKEEIADNYRIAKAARKNKTYNTEQAIKDQNRINRGTSVFRWLDRKGR